ncbi:hypothetical protein BJX68DRAFT_191240 [Aspergillus pseudodeflectus]|uniref:Uncharacterized protein n=1 Tax=Aspergillus pseudodeflectus TaxID=176178 RepID=A0ABR4KWR9_9EURO
MYSEYQPSSPSLPMSLASRIVYLAHRMGKPTRSPARMQRLLSSPARDTGSSGSWSGTWGRRVDSRRLRSTQMISHLRLNAAICFGNVWETRIVAFKIGIEEGLSQNWVANRAVSCWRFGPQDGPRPHHGANQAIESSARQSSEDCLCRKGAKPVTKRCVGFNVK